MEFPGPSFGDVFTVFDYLQFIGGSLGGLFKTVLDLVFNLVGNTDAMLA